MVDSTVQPFEFKGNQVRVLTDGDGAPWFIAKDVCDILGTHTKDIRATLDEDEISNVDTIDIGGFSTVIDVSNGGRSPIIISEPGLYRLVMRSRKPVAKEFQRWVTHDVLPQIRRTGGYLPVNDTDDEKAILAKAALIAQRTMSEQAETITRQQRELDERRPLALLGEAFVSTDGTMSVTQAARHFQTIDRRMTRDMVYGLLRGAGYVETHGNAPTKRAIKPGYLVQRQHIRDDHRLGRPYARFTTKGVNRFIRRFIYGDGQPALEGVD
nr:MAG TPA: repressor domain protein [Caudoviricetes sp.]